MIIFNRRSVLTCAIAIIAASFVTQARAGDDKDKDKKHDVSLQRLVVVGDSLSAGFQNFSLLDSQQVNGYAALIAKQAGAPLTLPLISYPGIPPVLTILGFTPGGFPIIAPVPDPNGPGQRENPGVQATDLAVPGFRIGDILNTTPHGPPFDPNNPIDYLTFSVLGLPGLLATPPIAKSEVQWAEALHPSFVILWGGNNDALGAVMAGTDKALTPLPIFEQNFSQTLSRLAANHTPVVVATIPDVTSLPYLVPVAVLPPNITYPSGAIYVTLDGLSAAFAALKTQPGYALNDAQTLTATEIGNIQSAVNQYNQIIWKDAWQNHATVVDTNLLVKILSVFGYYVDGRHLTTQFLGGLFSLDGVHPSNTGYAILADFFIEIINLNYHKHIPLVDVSEVAENDPFVKTLPASPKPSYDSLKPEAMQGLKAILGH